MGEMRTTVKWATGKHGTRAESAEGGPGNADRTTQTPHGLYLHSPLCFRKDIIVQD